MLRKLLSMLLCATLLLTVIPFTSVSVSAEDEYKTLPTSFSPPTIYVTSDKSRVTLNVVHSDDMQRFLESSEGYWGDAEGGKTNSDYWWTEYGSGYRFYTYVQFDWRIPGGQWHSDENWSTVSYSGFNTERVTYDDFDNWGDCTGTYFHIFNNENCYSAEQDSVYYPVKDYFDEFYDGWDYYYLFDQSKTLEFRARYAVNVAKNYYSVDENATEEKYGIFSDWTNTIKYGAANNAQATTPASLPAPTIENPYISEGTGYEGANEIKFNAFTPKDVAYLAELNLDIEEETYKYVPDVNLVIEASLDGENWAKISYPNPTSKEYSVDSCDVWFKFIRTDEESWGDFVWYTRDVYLRAKYYVEYTFYDYSEEEIGAEYVEQESPYSEVVKVNVPGVNRYTITMDYKNYGGSDYATKTFTRTENERIGWIHPDLLEGFWIETVVVNGTTMYDKADESSYELLEWDGDDYFRFIGDPYASEDLLIEVTFDGVAPVKHELVYSIGEGNTGSGYVEFTATGYYEDVDYDKDVILIYDAMTPLMTVKARAGSVVGKVVLNGTELNVPENVTEFEYQLPAVTSAQTLEVEFYATSFQVRESSSGKGNVTVTSPDYYDPSDEMVNKGDDVTFVMEALEGYEILRVNLDNETDIDLTTLGKIAGTPLTYATYTIENVQKNHVLYVTFSDEETQYVTLTITHNEGGVVNYGSTTEQVVAGGSYGIHIEPLSGYKVAKIIDGGTEITNFVGDVYYAKNLTEDRTVHVEFELEGLPYIYGDVNHDGKVNLLDVTMIQKYIAKLIEFDENQLKYGDVTGSDGLTLVDVTTIQKYIAKLLFVFPVEEM